MQTLFDVGIAIVLFLQAIGEWLAVPMKALSFLGNEEFYLLAAPALYWVLDARLGLRVALLLMVSGSLNSAFKFAFRGPRPYWYSTEVQAFSSESSFGVPSGHSQHAMVVWPTMALAQKRRWIWAAAFLLAILIGITRIYLAVHFPHDVLLGWAIGLALLWLFSRLEAPIARWITPRPASQQLLIALAASLLLTLIGWAAQSSAGSWTMPADWLNNAGGDIQPLSLDGLLSNTGAFFGLAAGAIWIRAQGGFDAGGPWAKRLARFILGLAGVLLLWRGLGLVFPRNGDFLSDVLRYTRYALIGCWITGVAPMLFRTLKLSGAKNHPSE